MWGWESHHEQKECEMKKYVIALVDNDYGFPPVFFAKFGDTIGIVPKRENALVVDESEIEEYLDKAQKLSNKMMSDAFLPVEKARKAVKWLSLN